jgi:hypothetical protein
VIGANVGGIRYQIENGVNGFLVSTIEESAARMPARQGYRATNPDRTAGT